MNFFNINNMIFNNINLLIIIFSKLKIEINFNLHKNL